MEKDTIQIKLWKTSLKGEPCSTNEISKNRRISDRITKKLEESHKVDGRGPKEYEKAI